MKSAGYLAALLAAFTVFGCSDPEANASHSTHVHPSTSISRSSPPPSGHSIFHLESEWTTAQDERIRLSSLGNRVHVVAMVYTSCEVACPRIVADMRAIRAAADLPPQALGFVLVSIDPDRDTPERLRAFATRARLDQASWTLLRADETAVRELAAVLGVRYRPIEGGEFAHSNILSVIDRRGEVVHQQVGLDQSDTETLEVIAQSVQAF